ncbi:MAG: type IV pilus twitching motility protein PilT [Chloroflexota bacterium]
MQIDEVLKLMIQRGASDLHLMALNPPILRVDGILEVLDNLPVLSVGDVETILEAITTEEQRSAFYRDLELDFAHSIFGLGRFRVNVMRQRGTLSMAFRLVPFDTPSIDELGLPEVCKGLVLRPRGLILITGHTGSGKSTTLAAMIDYLNERERRNIITIEDPIEHLHRNKKSIIAQRELGDDTRSFSAALEHALRHDPDVIVVGEIRDLPTISTALKAAETGHLVMGTLHTSDAPQTVDRIVDMFPPDQQQQIRLQLSQVIEAVISQTLLLRANGRGRVAAFEVMMGNSAVRNIIREGKTFELNNVMQLSSREGMQTLDQALAALIKNGLVTEEDAMVKSSNPERLRKMLYY